MFASLKQDLARYPFRRQHFWRVKLLITSPGASSVFFYRLQKYSYDSGWLLIAYFIQRLNLLLHSIDIVPGAQIGPGLRIDHPVGIVIGGKVSIGVNCTILHQVTLGTRQIDIDKYNDGFPVIGDNVIIGCGSSVLGRVTVGDNATIGAGSIILKEVFENKTVYGIHK
jgi:serine O-acetyltransferase